ncbi:MAG TPA: POTRA domain-containing protein, partial [Vicinamibacteria bacterium]|nr:POTRA domain-containing protein [Vicinamibacteria bacterium]
MSKKGIVLAACLLVLGLVSPARAQETGGETPARPGGQAPLIQEVDVAGNQFLQRETLLYYVQARPGERYDEKKLRDDFKRLWDTGFLDDLRVESFDGPGGKIVRFTVTERKRIQIVDYRGSKDLTTSNIEDELKKRDSQIKIDTFYDPVKARKVETIIKEMLAE